MNLKNAAFCDSRRNFLATVGGLSAMVLAGRAGLVFAAGEAMAIAALFAGKIDDRGFMEAGYRGLERARTELGVSTRHIDGVLPRKDQLVTALRELASSGADLVVAHGGQNNEATEFVAAEFPDVLFVVTQGSVTGPNLSSYEVLQEQSAYLGGALAGLMTRTGVVGHMSGIRVKPGLKGRAAYIAGVKAVNPDVKVLTNFSGNQDDNALSKRIAEAEIAAGADIIFTMLNAGRNGVTEACREKRVRQIGNVIDWVKMDPTVFIASAVADVSMGVFNSIRDLRDGRFRPGIIEKIGLADEQAVRLTMSDDVPEDVRAQIDRIAEEIRAGRIEIPENYEGPEFEPPATS